MTLKKFNIKRVYDLPDSGDGYRVLVDRLWPRGLKKETARIDEWNKDIAPSAELRKWFGHKEERFPEFVSRYREELRAQTTELERLKKIGEAKKVTLLYAARDPLHNNASVLLQVLAENSLK